MEKKLKLSFKTNKPKGRYAWTSSPFHYIKLNGEEIGNIEHEKPHFIRLMVFKENIMEDGNPNSTWKWIQLRKESGSIDIAKEYLNENIKIIFEKYKIRSSEK